MSNQHSDLCSKDILQQHFVAMPIFTSERQRYAIELLQQQGDVLSALCINATDTAFLVLQADMLRQVVEDYGVPVLLDVAAQCLFSKVLHHFDPLTVIINVPNSCLAEPGLGPLLRQYQRSGYRFALDYPLTETLSAELMPLFSIFRLNILQCDLDAFARLKAELHDSPGLWLAQQVDSERKFSLCSALGCSLFQGSFLPDMLTINDKKIEPGALKLAQILGCLFAAEPDINRLSQLLSDEPAIVIAMLKIANSPLYRKARDVGSVKEMVTRLGLELVRKWILLYAVMGSSTEQAAITVLARAYSTQRIAQHWQLAPEQCEQYFLAAIISGADMLFGIASTAFLPYLALDSSIEQAIRFNSGKLADALAIVRGIEQGYALRQPANATVLPYVGFYADEMAQIHKRLALAKG